MDLTRLRTATGHGLLRVYSVLLRNSESGMNQPGIVPTIARPATFSKQPIKTTNVFLCALPVTIYYSSTTAQPMTRIDLGMEMMLTESKILVYQRTLKSRGRQPRDTMA